MQDCYQSRTCPSSVLATELFAQYRPLTRPISPTANRSGILAPSSIKIVSDTSAGEKNPVLTNGFWWLACLRTQRRADPPRAAAIDQQVRIFAGHNASCGVQSGLACEVG